MLITRQLPLLLIALLAACSALQPPSTPVQTTPIEANAVAPGARLYVTGDQIDTTRFLAPPPNEDTTRREIELMLVLQNSRTKTQVDRSVADFEQSIFRFADVMGDKFTQDKLPKTARLFATLYKTEGALTKQGKEKWARPRPPTADPRIQPVTRYGGGSYPSGHATFSHLSAIVLAQLVPEKQLQIFERAREFGDNRVLGGVHYPSDVEAGRQLAVMIAVLIQNNPVYQQDFAEAKAELRRVLGLY